MIDLAREHARLNGIDNARFENGDVLETLVRLKGEGTRFDVVICDPPKYARQAKDIDHAVKGYIRLNLAALDVLEPDGVLVTCSCSGLVGRELFVELIGRVAEQSGRSIQILEQRGQSPDHPISASCLETEYLKVPDLPGAGLIFETTRRSPPDFGYWSYPTSAGQAEAVPHGLGTTRATQCQSHRLSENGFHRIGVEIGEKSPIFTRQRLVGNPLRVPLVVLAQCRSGRGGSPRIGYNPCHPMPPNASLTGYQKMASIESAWRSARSLLFSPGKGLLGTHSGCHWSYSPSALGSALGRQGLVENHRSAPLFAFFRLATSSRSFLSVFSSSSIRF